MKTHSYYKNLMLNEKSNRHSKSMEKNKKIIKIRDKNKKYCTNPKQFEKKYQKKEKSSDNLCFKDAFLKYIITDIKPQRNVKKNNNIKTNKSILINNAIINLNMFSNNMNINIENKRDKIKSTRIKHRVQNLSKNKVDQMNTPFLLHLKKDKNSLFPNIKIADKLKNIMNKKKSAMKLNNKNLKTETNNFNFRMNGKLINKEFLKLRLTNNLRFNNIFKKNK